MTKYIETHLQHPFALYMYI